MASAVQSCITPLSSRAKPGQLPCYLPDLNCCSGSDARNRQSWQAFRYRTSVAMNNLPLAILAPVDLRCSEGIDAGLAVDDCLGVLVSHGVGDVARGLCCDDLESTMAEGSSDQGTLDAYLMLAEAEGFGRPDVLIL